MMSTIIRNYQSGSTRRQDCRRSRGFTLIELMIVVTIISILAAIAYPSYQNSVRKSRRADAKGVVLQASQWMERFYTTNNRYPTPAEFNANSLFTKSPLEGGPQAYTITVVRPTPNTFTLSATPIGPQTSDTDCGTLSLRQTGVKCILAGTKCSNVPADQQAVGGCW
jgi:type IV pilus assembly protein PilE